MTEDETAVLNFFILLNKACYKMFWHILTSAFTIFVPSSPETMAAVEVDFKYYLNNAVIPFLLILYLGAYIQLRNGFWEG